MKRKLEKIQVYDCFTFFNELDLLEIRLRILYPYIDKFVIVEMDETHSGEKKNYNFEKNKNRYKKYMDKIIYIKLKNPKRLHSFWKSRTYESLLKFRIFRVLINRLNLGRWKLENFQRNGIIHGLKDCNPNDLIIISDLDEIPNPKILERIKEKISYGDRIGLEQNLFYFYLNGLAINRKWVGPKIITYETLKDKFRNSPQRVRILKNLSRKIIDKDIFTIKKGGWHFTYLGGEQKVREKLESFAEIEKTKIVFDKGERDKFIPKEFFDGRSKTKIKYISLDSKLLPEEIRKNPKRYKKLILNMKTPKK